MQFSMREVAEMLLQLIDDPDGAVDADMGIDVVEYIGQGVHKLYVTRDVLEQIAGH